LSELNQMLHLAGGRVYPAKDCCLTQKDFAAFYPQWTEFRKHLDPRFSSGFWRRVTGKEGRQACARY